MPLRKRFPIETPQDRQVADRIKRAKAGRSPVDRTSRYHAALCDLARAYGLEPDNVIEEHAERSAVREYLGCFDRDEAERLAFCDVSERLAG